MILARGHFVPSMPAMVESRDRLVWLHGLSRPFFWGAPSSYTMDCSWIFLIPVLAALEALLAKIWHIVFPHDYHDSWLINFPDLLNCSSTCTHCCHCLDSNYQSATELLGIGELFQPLSANNYKSPTWDKPVGSFPGLPPLLSILVRSGCLGPQWFGGSQPCTTWKSLVFSWVCIPFTKKTLQKRLRSGLGWCFSPWLGYGSKPYTHGEHQNSWQMDVHPTKMVLVGIDPYPLGNPPYPDSNGRPP